MKEDLEKIYKSLCGSFELLSAAYEKKRDENSELQAKYQKLQSDCENYSKQIENLKNQISSKSLENAFLSASNSKEEAKDIIEQLIREINNCLKLIEKVK